MQDVRAKENSKTDEEYEGYLHIFTLFLYIGQNLILIIPEPSLGIRSVTHLTEIINLNRNPCAGDECLFLVVKQAMIS